MLTVPLQWFSLGFLHTLPVVIFFANLLLNNPRNLLEHVIHTLIWEFNCYAMGQILIKSYCFIWRPLQVTVMKLFCHNCQQFSFLLISQFLKGFFVACVTYIYRTSSQIANRQMLYSWLRCNISTGHKK